MVSSEDHSGQQKAKKQPRASVNSADVEKYGSPAHHGNSQSSSSNQAQLRNVGLTPQNSMAAAFPFASPVHGAQQLPMGLNVSINPNLNMPPYDFGNMNNTASLINNMNNNIGSLNSMNNINQQIQQLQQQLMLQQQLASALKGSVIGFGQFGSSVNQHAQTLNSNPNSSNDNINSIINNSPAGGHAMSFPLHLLPTGGNPGREHDEGRNATNQTRNLIPMISLTSSTVGHNNNSNKSIKSEASVDGSGSPEFEKDQNRRSLALLSNKRRHERTDDGEDDDELDEHDNDAENTLNNDEFNDEDDEERAKKRRLQIAAASRKSRAKRKREVQNLKEENSRLKLENEALKRIGDSTAGMWSLSAMPIGAGKIETIEDILEHTQKQVNYFIVNFNKTLRLNMSRDKWEDHAEFIHSLVAEVKVKENINH